MNPILWLPVPGYESLYAVSNMGQVKKTTDIGRLPAGTLIAGNKSARGYAVVALRKNGQSRAFMMHRLVALAFIGTGASKQEVLHSDGNSMNNMLTNLRWGSHSENELDKVRHGTHAMANKTHCPQGHEYDFSNTRICPRGKRSCRACSRIRGLARYYRLKA